MKVALVITSILALGTLILAACGGNGEVPTTQIVAAPTLASPNPVSATVAPITVLATVVPTLIPTTVAPTAVSATALPISTPVPATAVPTSTPGPATNLPTATPQVIEGELFLHLEQPEEFEVLTAESILEVVGRTRIDALVTINDTIVEPDIDGRFILDVDLEEDPNIIEIVASVASGEQKDLVVVAIYIP